MMVTLYNVSVSAIHQNLKRIFEDNELCLLYTSEQEAKNLENKIWELKKQNYILQKVLLDGDISSATFIK